jgi:hypothetical protein
VGDGAIRVRTVVMEGLEELERKPIKAAMLTGLPP